MSLLRTSYYQLKPYLPVKIRSLLRRKLAAYSRSRSAHLWPIKQGARRAPQGWPGWPDGKKFAFVLTHDVESTKGVERCLNLANLEIKLGFRSSFNFIPEGEYSTPEPLRNSLAASGFEIGVHDLYHDGKLYSSHADFTAHAARINSYLREWNARGFRSGFMHHNLEWLHELDIAYDMSTFDTDPFEPQPDGADTIFPFWVAGRNGRGYLEIPYTLPQDSTLFLTLEEKTIDVWKHKLDWIVGNGGLALVNVHPDYIDFGAGSAPREYPLAHYTELLEYVRSEYGSDAWFALPREVAAHVSQFRPQKRAISSKRISMLAYSFYESDNRVMRYAEALADRGDSVDVIALAKDSAMEKREAIQGVNVLRVQRRQRNEKGKFAYLSRLLRFFFKSSVVMSWEHLRNPYHVVHVHNVPDFLVFAAWLPKLMGARIILDIHDILPEFFESKFRESGDHEWYLERLLAIEKASCNFAHHVIISNHLWHQKLVSRSVEASHCSVVLNHVDTTIFYRRARTRSDDKLIAIFPGGLQFHQGLDIAIRAFSHITREFPQSEFHIYGDGTMKEPWMQLVRDLGLQKHVFFFAPLPIREVAEKIANADVGVVPKRADSFGNEAYSTKIMEFMSQGIPVVASRTKIDTFYFKDSAVTFFESGNSEELAAKIIALFRDPKHAALLGSEAQQYVAQNSWEDKKQEYFNIVDDQIGKDISPAQNAVALVPSHPELISA